MVGPVQDMMILEMLGRNLVFVLHLDGTLKVWDLQGYNRVFNYDTATATATATGMPAGEFSDSLGQFFMISVLYLLVIPHMPRAYSLNVICPLKVCHCFSFQMFSCFSKRYCSYEIAIFSRYFDLFKFIIKVLIFPFFLYFCRYISFDLLENLKFFLAMTYRCKRHILYRLL